VNLALSDDDGQSVYGVCDLQVERYIL